MRYRHAGTTTWITTTSATPAKQLVSLTPGMEYEYQIRARCNGVWSAYSFSAFFTTSSVAALAAPIYAGGVADEGEGLEIYVSPNPAGNTLNVHWRNEIPVAVTILHIVDEKVHLQLSDSATNFNTLDIGQLVPGAYVLRAHLSDGRITTTKFLKGSTGY